MIAALISLVFGIAAISVTFGILLRRERLARQRAEANARKQAEASTARLASLVESSHDAIIGETFDGTITDWNRAAERIFGYRAEELVGRPISLLIPPDRVEEMTQILRRILRGEHVESFETVRRQKDGLLLDISLTVSPVLNSEGQIVGTSAIARDITERKRAEFERERLHQEVLAGRERLEYLSRRLIEAQEAERRQLARELHDELGQTLTTIHLHLEALGARVGPTALPRLEECMQVVNQAIEQVRGLSLDLRPPSLDLLGLENALRALLNRRAACGELTVQLVSTLSGERLSPALETVCFRVVQEALTNTLRHAHAGCFWVALARADEELHLIIRDDGKGFDVAAAQRGTLEGHGFGLLSIQERVYLFGGQIEIASAPGQGTTIRVRFPAGGPSAP